MTQLTELEYNAIAHAALAHFAMEGARLHFLQYSGGITFRVDSGQESNVFLLKIHHQSDSGLRLTTSPQAILARHTWLRALGETTELVIQMPLPNQQGDLLTLIEHSTSETPYPCTLQKWVEGSAFDGHLTPAQIRQIGTMMARFHQFSNEWSALSTVANDLPLYEPSELAQHVQILSLAVECGLLTNEDYALIQAAQRIIAKTVEGIGRDPQRWGPIHSDFHHGNLVFNQDEIYLIDFDCLSLSPYACDLGIMLYHIHYQGPAIYAALIEGYEAVRPLPVASKDVLEAFVTQTAISNLAFNVIIPEQHTQPYLPRNLRQLVDEFCVNLVADRHFLFR